MPSEGTGNHAELHSPTLPQSAGCSWPTETFPLTVVGQPPGALRALAVTVSGTVSENATASSKGHVHSQTCCCYLGHKALFFFFLCQVFDFVHPPPFPKNKLERICKLCLDVLKAYYFLQRPVCALCILFSFKVNMKAKFTRFTFFLILLGMNNW